MDNEYVVAKSIWVDDNSTLPGIFYNKILINRWQPSKIVILFQQLWLTLKKKSFFPKQKNYNFVTKYRSLAFLFR